MWALRVTMPSASCDEVVHALMAASEVFDKTHSNQSLWPT
ncbi:hypothetical protein MAUB1S_10094 [Mycolicibacterium aubagnense]